MQKIKKYRYSEIFGKTIQGEGHYTGVPTAWVRFFGCNLECNGFGQDNPTDPDTYQLPYQTIDLTDITAIEQLPVFDKGCDSSMSWSSKYRHLAHMDSAGDIVTKIEDVIRSESNPNGLFLHPRSKQSIHMCFTGGEPIMSQHAIVDIMDTFSNKGNVPDNITVETNGTTKLKQPIIDTINNWARSSAGLREWFWSVSPKLWHTSGEKDAVCPDIVAQYQAVSNVGQLKFVVDGTEQSWDEMESAVQAFRDVGVNWPVWVMPVGATDDAQRNIQAEICEQTFERGYNFSARVHAWVFDNVIGK